MSHLKKRYRKRELFAVDPPDLDAVASEPDNGFEDAERVHYALDQIPILQREVLTLHFLDDLSLADIAQVLGVPEGTVKSRLYHAKRALREVLEKEDRTNV